jgi:hypothetical protein
MLITHAVSFLCYAAGKALQDAIEAFEGTIALVQQALGASLAGPGLSAALPAQNRSSPAYDSCTTQHASMGQHNASAHSRMDAGACSSADGLAGTAASDMQAVLAHLHAGQVRVHAIMQQLGGCVDADPHTQLYSAQLLQKALADPNRVAQHLGMPKAERLDYWSKVRNAYWQG